MRLPDEAHAGQPWRIHEIARDFEIEDVWELPTPGGPHDFPRLVDAIAAGDPAQRSTLVRALFAIRLRVGALMGWDRAETGLDSRVATLRGRLPADLRDGPRGPDSATLPFRSLYQTDREWATEIANATVHAVMHVGWVPDGEDGHRGQMAVLVKPNGRRGRAYMAAIKPARRLVVYPRMLREIGRRWRAGA